ncbi:MAG: hypothetical protein JRC77_04935 [Deltaproteobacteria bacterium]|nr:hypothetical protein [Deltaproteobacteria bacterium]
MAENSWILNLLVLLGPLLVMSLVTLLTSVFAGLVAPSAWLIGFCLLAYLLGAWGYCTSCGVRFRIQRPAFFVPVDMSPRRRNAYSMLCFLCGFSFVSWFVLI